MPRATAHLPAAALDIQDATPAQPAQPVDEDAEPAGAAAPSSSQANAARSSELARLFDALVSRMRAVGADDFFIQQDGRHTQLEWLALQVGSGVGLAELWPLRWDCRWLMNSCLSEDAACAHSGCSHRCLTSRVTSAGVECRAGSGGSWRAAAGGGADGGVRGAVCCAAGPQPGRAAQAQGEGLVWLCTAAVCCVCMLMGCQAGASFAVVPGGSLLPSTAAILLPAPLFPAHHLCSWRSSWPPRQRARCMRQQLL